MSSVKVAVRLRPFSEREKNMNAKLCVNMAGNSTTIDSFEDSKDGQKTFSFDYSYWSHDGFEVDETGYFRPITAQYADQQRLYNEIGKDVLNNAYDGYNACLFAYGQTGAGKSYSMVGYGANKGIIVRACEEIFTRIDSNTDPHLRAEVHISMLEIYNEQVQDLLTPLEKRPKGGLKIRHTPQLGTFVQDLSKCPVDSYAAIQAKLDEGTANRTVGATLMNATSSRAHTVLQINFRQISIDPTTGEPVSQKSSEISLVDLAGSERAGSTGAMGDRLKEGCAINQSLSALGNVISALADKAAGKLKPGQVVPYRDSALTRILQTALGGNSKTCMIAALSPATVNYEETLSTLRYADRVKQIKNEAVVNENPLEKLIRELREENERLRRAMGGVLPSSGAHAVSGQAVDDLRRQYEEELEANRRALQEMTTSWQDKLLAEKQRRAADGGCEGKESLKVPYLSNLNEDPFLTGKLIFPLREGQSTIGKSGGSADATFHIGGLGVVFMHAVLDVTKVQSSEESSDDPVYRTVLTAQGKTSVNGEVLQAGEARILSHKDRIVFGHSNMYVFVDPTDVDKALPSWEDGMRELTKEAFFESAPQQSGEVARVERRFLERWEELQADAQLFESEERELLRRLKDKEAFVLASEENQVVAQSKLKQIAAEKRAIQQELDRKEEEIRTRRMLLEKERIEEVKRQDAERAARVFLEEVMSKTVLLVDEGNAYAQELGVGVYFSMKLNTQLSSAETLRYTNCGTSLQHTQIVIQVQRVDTDIVQIWNLDLFEKKLFEMRELYAQWAARPDRSFYLQDSLDDPFALDMESYQVIGESYLYLDVIRCLLPLDKEVFPIIDANGKICGKLTVSMAIHAPTEELQEKKDERGQHQQSDVDLDAFQSVEDFKGREIDITITVLYRWLDGDTTVATALPEHIGRDAVFNNSKKFRFQVDDAMIESLSGALVFEARGKVLDKKAKFWGKKERSEKQKKADQLGHELRESENLLQQVEIALRQQGRSIGTLLESL
ncbi:hypothetical protein Efla_004047 [Eimeria flavescens]